MSGRRNGNLFFAVRTHTHSRASFTTSRRKSRQVVLRRPRAPHFNNKNIL